jgi:Tfp pilus assembly protein PilZ
MMIEQRDARQITISVDVVVEAESAHYVVEILNLSGTSLSLRTKKAFPVGTRLRLVFGMPLQLPRIDVNGTVTWSEKGEGVGVEFTSLSPEHKQALRRFLNSDSR